MKTSVKVSLLFLSFVLNTINGQNNENVLQNNENVPQNNENVPQNNENVPQNNENVPQNNENVPQNNENVPQNSGSGTPNNGNANAAVPQCNSATIQCVCGIGESVKYVPVELKAATTNDPSTGALVCSGYADPYQACANISCSVAPNNTLPSGDEKSFISNFYPKVFTINKGEYSGELRFARQAEACHVTPLKNAEIKCYKWPNWLNCDINCIYGHALRVGEKTVQSTNINCRSTENKWKPHGFYECEPYLNCKVNLVKPGDLKCHQPASGPTYCDISCLDYEDKEATSRQRYECVDENFARNLPHCAVIREGVNTIRRPK